MILTVRLKSEIKEMKMLPPPRNPTSEEKQSRFLS